MKRISLAAAANLAAVCIVVPAPVPADYKLHASAEQTLRLSGGKPSPCCHVLPPGSAGEAIIIGSRDGDAGALTLPADAEYTIRVYQMGAAARCRPGVGHAEAVSARAG